MRYFLRFALLTIAFALTTWGLLRWQAAGFGFEGFLSLEQFPVLHPVLFMVFGLALIPPTLWDIFLLEGGNTP